MWAICNHIRLLDLLFSVPETHTQLTNELSEAEGPVYQCILSDVYIINVQWFSLSDEVCV